MNDPKHITLQMNKLEADKSLAKSQDTNNEDNDDINGGGLSGPQVETDDADDSNVGVDDGLLADNEKRGGCRVGCPMPNGCSGCVERPTPDLNVYQSRKTLAQGMMDLALFTANAHQLRHVWETKSHQPYFYFSIVFISVSILFQIAVGAGLIWNYRYDIKNEEQIRHAYRNNNYTLLGIFMITILNVLISVFAVQEQAPVFPESTTDCVP